MFSLLVRGNVQWNEVVDLGIDCYTTLLIHKQLKHQQREQEQDP